MDISRVRELELHTNQTVMLTIKTGKIYDKENNIFIDKLYYQQSVVLGYDDKHNQLVVRPIRITHGYKPLERVNLKAINDVILQTSN